MGTTGGLSRYDAGRKKFRNYREADGLANDFVYGILEDSEGYYWLANHRNFGGQFQLFRLKNFPAKTIKETFPSKKNIHQWARSQLHREELALQASNNGEKKLSTCLRTARHYQSCLEKKSGLKGIWPWN